MTQRPVFLGGIISALIARCAFAPLTYDFVAWFALVPFIFSLHRNRHSHWLRLTHGLCFGLALVLWCQSWFFDALLPKDAGVVDSLQALLKSSGAWISIAIFSGAFALAAGPFVRSRNLLFGAVGLAIVWTGLEVIRGHLELPWVAGWLSLGYALDGSSSQAQIARFVGVHGLSFLLILSSGFLTATLIETRAPMQVAYALMAGSIPLLLSPLGLSSDSPRAVDRPGEFRTAIFSGSHSPDELVNIVESLTRFDASFTVLPRPTHDSSETNTIVDKLADLLKARGGVFLRKQNDIMVVYTAVAGSAGRPTPLEEKASVYESADGRFGLGVNFDYLRTLRARMQCRGGADLLVSNLATTAEWKPKALEQILNMQRFRAVENRRWMIYVSSTGAFILDASGKTRSGLQPGVTGAGVDVACFTNDDSVYSRWGWFVEPTFALLTLTAIGWSFLTRKRANASSPDDLPAALQVNS